MGIDEGGVRGMEEGERECEKSVGEAEGKGGHGSQIELLS